MEKPMEQLVFSYQDISEKLGKSRSTIARWVRNDRFPPPRQIAPHVVGWLQRDIDQWIDSLPFKNLNQKARAFGVVKEECNQ